MSPLTKKILKIRAKLVTGGRSFDGLIENFTDDEIYVVTMPFNSFTDFSSGIPVKVKFELSSKEMVDLTGRVKWTYITPPHGLTRSIGIEVFSSHFKYGELFSSMH